MVFVIVCLAAAWTPTPPAAASARGQHRASVVRAGILKTLDPLLTAELLYALRSAGHGDVIAVVDANFPAAATALDTAWEDSIVLAGADLPSTLSAITSLLPLDLFVDDPVGVMVPSEGNSLPPLAVEVQSEAIAAIEANCGGGLSCEEVERFEFYERAREAYAIVQCAERRPYGCFLLTKGVVGPDGKDLKP